MGALSRTAATISLALAAPADAQGIDRWTAQIDEASTRFGIPAPWIRRVIEVESGARETVGGKPITSRAGAMGLMQLMPGTWAEMRRTNGLGPDPYEPRDNILAGTAYLRAMYDRFGYPGLFAAYNAGPSRYAEHLSTGRQLPSETIAYAAALGASGSARAPFRDERAQAGIFVQLVGSRRASRDAGPPPSAASAIFAHLGADPPAFD